MCERLVLNVSFFLLYSDAEFPFNEERVIPDGVNRDSAIIGGKKKKKKICESSL